MSAELRFRPGRDGAEVQDSKEVEDSFHRFVIRVACVDVGVVAGIMLGLVVG